MGYFLKLMVFLFIFLLSACSTALNNNDQTITYSVNVDLDLAIYEWLGDDASLEWRMTTNDSIKGIYDISIIEERVSELNSFPYKMQVVNKDLEEYAIIVQDTFDLLKDESAIGGDLPLTTHKPKLEITVTYNTDIICLSFYQNEETEISSMNVFVKTEEFEISKT